MKKAVLRKLLEDIEKGKGTYELPKEAKTIKIDKVEIEKPKKKKGDK